MSATTLTNTLNNLQNTLKNSASNISNAKAVGGFNVESISQSRSSTALGGGATVYQRNNFIMKGELTNTGISSDLAIGGRDTTGLFVVKRTNGDVAYTADGSIRRGTDSGFYLADGSAILGWQFDSSGKLPTNTATTSSLTPLTLRNAASNAIPTSKINLGTNLKATQKAIQGAGGIMNVTKNGVTNTSNPKEIITPGNGPLGELHIGDQLILKTSDIGTDYTFEYGGIAISKKISASNPMYGKINSNEFTVTSAVSSATNLQEGSGLTITINGGKVYTFTATSQAGAAITGKFNSMQSLADAIDDKKDLRARVVDGRLYISAYDADLGLTFADTNNSLLTATLGLDTVPGVGKGTTKRFATVEEAQQKIADTSGLDAEIDNAGNMEFNAASPLATLQLGGENRNSRSIFTVKAGPIDATTRATQLKNVATIQSPNHGLKAGDYVRLTGGVAPIADGIFRVQEENGDEFSVGTRADLANADVGGAALAQGLSLSTVSQLLTPNFKWQKVDGGASFTTTSNPLAAVAAQIATNVGTSATITGFTANTFTNAWQNAVGDIVYIQGSRSIRDGYYRITTAGNDQGFTVATVTGIGAGNLDSDLTVAMHPAQADPGLRITKVSSQAGNVANGLDTFPLQLTTGSTDVIVDVGAAHKHTVGDVIAFRDTATDVVTHDHVTITKNKYYKIKSITNTSITFTADGVNATTTDRIGFQNTCDNAGGGLAQLAGTVLGANAYIDYISREYNGLGIEINTGEDAATVITDTIMNAPLASTYDPVNTSKSFASGNVTERTFTTPISIIDNLGVAHNVSVIFGKIAQNTWAVEVNADMNGDGSYDTNSDKKGQLAYGQILFDGTGQLKSVDNALNAPLIINWGNGALSSNVKIDWGAITGKSTDGKPITGGMTQIDSDNNTRFVKQNGKLPGNINGFKFDEDGVLSATFDNGETIPVGKIALATFTNLNGLNQKDGFLYESSDSGTVLLKSAGVGGVGEIIVGGITSSAVNDTGEYMNVIDTTQASAMAVNIAAKINGSKDQLVNNLAR